jgi:hypothetical protein
MIDDRRRMKGKPEKSGKRLSAFSFQAYYGERRIAIEKGITTEDTEGTEDTN